MTLLRWWQRLNLVLAYASAVSIIGVIALVGVDVFSRKVLNRPIVGVHEISVYLLVYAGFLPVAWIFARDGHVRVDILVHFLRGRARGLANLLADGLGVAYGAIFTWITAVETWRAYVGGLRFSGELGAVPQALVLVVLPIGFLALTCQAVIASVQDAIDLAQGKDSAAEAREQAVPEL